MPYQLIPKGQFGANVSTEPTVTVTRDAFFVNKAARDAFGVDAFGHAELHGDPDGGRVGTRLLEQPTVNSRSLRSKENSLSVSAQSAVKLLGIRPGRYPLTHDKKQGLLEFSYEGGAAKSDPREDDGAAEETARRGRRRK